MTYTLGKKSRAELVGVDEPLIEVVEYALSISTIDFAVHDGLRTDEEQAALVAAGASRTMKSYHLLGKAVDLVPYVNGKLRWEWEPIYKVTRAVKRAAEVKGLKLIWGAVWDREIGSLSDNIEVEVERYIERRRALGKKEFLDGPHFQTVKHS